MWARAVVVVAAGFTAPFRAHVPVLHRRLFLAPAAGRARAAHSAPQETVRAADAAERVAVPAPQPTRRAVLAGLAAAVAPTAAHAFEAAPAVGSPFEWSALWDTRGSAAVQQPKRTGLRTEEVAAILETDLKEGKYILTGALTPEIFADDCRFVDPNNAVNGLAKYRKALSFLFRPEESTLQDVRVSVTSDKSAITAQYTASGVLNKE